MLNFFSIGMHKEKVCGILSVHGFIHTSFVHMQLSSFVRMLCFNMNSTQGCVHEAQSPRKSKSIFTAGDADGGGDLGGHLDLAGDLQDHHAAV